MGRRNTVLGIALCTAAFGSHALSMGPSHGTAVIGQPLNLSFDVNLDPGSDAASACAGAELYYGETRIDGSRFRVTALPGIQPSQAVVQVASQVAVNEPVVSVVLRAGCGQTLSRRYVLLSSSPQESPAPAADGTTALRALPQVPAEAGASAGAASPARRARTARPAAAPDGTTASTGERPASVRPPAAPVEPRPTPAPRVSRPPAESPTAAPIPRGRSRLELQSPADWLEEHGVPLQSSLSMAPPVAASPEQRTAAAALWRTLNGATEGTAPVPSADAGRLRALELQLKVLQDSVARSRGRETELQAQLDAAQGEGDRIRFFLWPALFVTLLALLALAVGIYRRRTGQRSAWWKPARSAPDGLGPNTTSMYEEPDFVDTMPSILGETALPDAVEFYPSTFPPRNVDDHGVPVPQGAAAPAVAAVPAPAGSGAAKAPKPQRSTEPVAEAVLGAVGGASMAAASATLTPAPNSLEAAAAAARELRTSSADALFDVQQNAEFFASLGQYEQAIDVLQHYIAEHPGTSPAAYIDLLRILHTLSLTEPYRKLRDEFNSSFNAEAPAFAGFLKPTRGLEAFPEALHRIETAWNKPQVLDVIETLLFRRLAGEDASLPSFPLEAYRELLLLYEVAKARHAGAPDASPPAAASGNPPATALHATPVVVAAAALQPAPAPSAAPVAPSVTLPEPVAEAQPAPVTRTVGKPAVREPVALLDDFPQAPLPSKTHDLDVPLDFPEPSASLLADFDLLPSSPPPSELEIPAPAPKFGFSAPPADDNLIDFDLFDVQPPPDGPKR